MAKVSLSILTLGLPIVFTIELAAGYGQTTTTRDNLLFFTYQLITITSIIFIGISASSFIILRLMTEIFGVTNIHEKKIVKKTLVVLSASMLLRLVAFLGILFTGTDKIEEFFDLGVIFSITTFAFWIVIELIPSFYLFKIHYSNFITLEGQEYLQTDYDENGIE